MVKNQVYFGVRQRFRIIGIPSELIGPVSRQISNWVQYSGLEWTIARLKEIKLIAIHKKAGIEYHPNWIALKANGLPKGPFGPLLAWGLAGKLKTFVKLVQALQSYTYFRFEGLTPSQEQKFLSQVQADYTPKGCGLTELEETVRAAVPNYPSVDRSQDISLVTFRGSPTKRLPKIHEWEKSRPQNEDVLHEASFVTIKSNLDLVKSHAKLYAPVLEGLEIGSELAAQEPGYRAMYQRHHVHGGSIGFIQEQGGKLRYVANPHLVHQLALKPLGDAIYKVVKQLPWDCTFDQQKPIQELQCALRFGKTVHSTDLSAATDFFPLDLQINTLAMLFGGFLPDLDLLYDLCRSSWRLPFYLKGHGGYVAWTRGQPLGLYPSFGMFTLTHGMVLMNLSMQVHHDTRYHHDFYVVGDDVVILNDELHMFYMSALEYLGCPYSPSKSLSSNKLCEFAGKIITEDAVIPQMKWRQLSNDNFIDLARNLGPKILPLLSRRQRVIVDIIQHALPPWGLNWSFNQPDLAKQVEITLELEKRAFEKAKAKQNLVRTNRILNNNFYKSDLNWFNLPDLAVLREKSRSADEAVRQVYLEVLKWDPQPIEGYATILSQVDAYLGTEYSKRLPVDFSSNRYKSTLDRYEEIFL